MVYAVYVDRDMPVDFPTSRVTNLPPYAYDHVGIEDDPVLYVNAPWFNRESIDDAAEIRLYVTDGWLPGGFPIEAVFAVCCKNQFSCYSRDFRVPRGRTLQIARVCFASLAMNGFNRFMTHVVCDPTNTGMFMHCTRREIQYLHNLDGMSGSDIEGWRNREVVSSDALCFPGPQLVMEFRFRRMDNLYWSASVRNERRCRSKHGCAIPYQCLNTFDMKGEYFQRAFPRLISGWARIEVPRGCLAELPPAFNNKSEKLKRSDTVWWVVAYTEMASKTAAFVLLYSYDRFRLWALSRLMLSFIRTLDLVSVLGNRQNAEELLEMLDRISETYFSTLPSIWSSRGRVPSSSPGRDEPGADCAWYDPYGRRFVSVDAARVLANSARISVPNSHPTGWDYSCFRDGFDMPPGGHVIRFGYDQRSGCDDNAVAEGSGLLPLSVSLPTAGDDDLPN